MHPHQVNEQTEEAAAGTPHVDAGRRPVPGQETQNRRTDQDQRHSPLLFPRDSQQTGGCKHHGERLAGYHAIHFVHHIVELDELIKLPEHTAVVIYNGRFGTLDMPKYWELFDMPIRIKKASPSDYLNDEKTAI